MKKLFLTTALIATYATTSFAAFPTGQFKGHGRWKDDKGNTGVYEVQATSTPQSLDNTYHFGYQTKSFKMDLGPDQNGFFDVSIGGNKVGDGYCMTVQCHYSLSTSNLEESIVFWQGHLYRTGSKSTNGIKIGWEEDLTEVTEK